MYLLFDIGGTKMRFAFSENGISFEEPRIISTPKNFAEAVEVFHNAGRELARGRKIRLACGGITRALVSGDHSLIDPLHRKNEIEAFRQECEKKIGAPVFFENDSAVCGLGEAVYGAGRGNKIVAYMTVSTGVGGARVVNGRIDESSLGFEPGYQILDMPHSFRPQLNREGNLQGFVSGYALEKRFGRKPKEIIDSNIWEELAGELAYGLNNTIVHWSPDIVVLGGSMITGTPAISVPRVATYLKEILHIYHKIPNIKKAELKDLGGLWGALELAHQKDKGKETSVGKINAVKDGFVKRSKGFFERLLS